MKAAIFSNKAKSITAVPSLLSFRRHRPQNLAVIQKDWAKGWHILPRETMLATVWMSVGCVYRAGKSDKS